MSEGAVGLIVLVIISTSAAYLSHRWIAHFAAASLCATVASCVLFQLAAYAYSGHVDPFIKIAVVISALAALTIAIVVGMLMDHRQKSS
ncbi:MAG: hypothetical protein KA914_16270 [Ottowia sp.]|jgi:hypothetical protein|nr:hypothetical protein [Ottowia sp.]